MGFFAVNFPNKYLSVLIKQYPIRIHLIKISILRLNGVNNYTKKRHNIRKYTKYPAVIDAVIDLNVNLYCLVLPYVRSVT